MRILMLLYLQYLDMGRTSTWHASETPLKIYKFRTLFHSPGKLSLARNTRGCIFILRRRWYVVLGTNHFWMILE